MNKSDGQINLTPTPIETERESGVKQKRKTQKIKREFTGCSAGQINYSKKFLK